MHSSVAKSIFMADILKHVNVIITSINKSVKQTLHLLHPLHPPI